MKKLVVYSGGLDSFTLLHSVLNTYRMDAVQDTIALSFDYGQRHKKELGFAREVTARLGIQHKIIDLRSVGSSLPGSSLTDATVDTPHGHYAADNMKRTVVPGRNTIMLSIAMGIAEAMYDLSKDEKYAAVFYGAHAGDHFIYPDCRPEYIASMQDVFRAATEGRVRLFAPFQYQTKGLIVRAGIMLGLDYSQTWTCYEGGDVPCGKCGACVERAEAFDVADVPDPLITKGSAF